MVYVQLHTTDSHRGFWEDVFVHVFAHSLCCTRKWEFGGFYIPMTSADSLSTVTTPVDRTGQEPVALSNT